MTCYILIVSSSLADPVSLALVLQNNVLDLGFVLENTLTIVLGLGYLEQMVQISTLKFSLEKVLTWSWITLLLWILALINSCTLVISLSISLSRTENISLKARILLSTYEQHPRVSEQSLPACLIAHSPCPPPPPYHDSHDISSNHWSSEEQASDWPTHWLLVSSRPEKYFINRNSRNYFVLPWTWHQCIWESDCALTSKCVCRSGAVTPGACLGWSCPEVCLSHHQWTSLLHHQPGQEPCPGPSCLLSLCSSLSPDK